MSHPNISHFFFSPSHAIRSAGDGAVQVAILAGLGPEPVSGGVLDSEVTVNALAGLGGLAAGSVEAVDLLPGVAGAVLDGVELEPRNVAVVGALSAGGVVGLDGRGRVGGGSAGGRVLLAGDGTVAVLVGVEVEEGGRVVEEEVVARQEDVVGGQGRLGRGDVVGQRDRRRVVEQVWGTRGLAGRVEEGGDGALGRGCR